MRKKILVTGGMGFIGSHTVVELYEKGYEPIIVDDLSNSHLFVKDNIEKIIGSNVNFYEASCLNQEALRKIFFKEKNIEGVIHFAAFKAVGESVDNPLNYYRNNVVSLLNLLDVMVEQKVGNLVFSSSCTVYGEPEQIPVSEHEPRQEANSPYGNTKSICEDILRDLSKTSTSIKSIALRYFNPIGAHESSLIGELPIGKPNNLIPFITQTAVGKREGLTIFGDDYETEDGSCIRDYIHVTDLANAHIKAIEKNLEIDSGNYGVYNIGTGKGNSVFEVINVFEKVTKCKLNYSIGSRRPGDVQAVFADVRYSESNLGWKAEKTLEESLLSAWNWELELKKLNNGV